MIRIRIIVSVFLLAGSVCTQAQQSISAAEQQLNSIIAEYWDVHLYENPIEATQIGLNDYNDRMPAVAAPDQLRQLEAEKRFLRRSGDIDREACLARDSGPAAHGVRGGTEGLVGLLEPRIELQSQGEAVILEVAPTIVARHLVSHSHQPVDGRQVDLGLVVQS